jgi:hypothetical protein
VPRRHSPASPPAAFWSTLLSALAPELQRLEDEDRAAGRPADHRVRIGLYCYAEPVSGAPAEAPATGAPDPRPQGER